MDILYFTRWYKRLRWKVRLNIDGYEVYSFYARSDCYFSTEKAAADWAVHERNYKGGRDGRDFNHLPVFSEDSNSTIDYSEKRFQPLISKPRKKGWEKYIGT